MAKRKNLSNEAKEKILERKILEEKILKLLALVTTSKSLEEDEDEIKNYLRSYVELNSLGLTPKGYKFWEGNTAGVELQDNPIHETDVGGLIAKIGLAKAVEFLSINRTALLAAIEAKTLPLNFEELKAITRTSYGKKKVIPYYGRKNIQEAILPKKEVVH